ncbi:MAG: hypothetical protein Q7R95_09165 [bacterium]|nr:hypothetical protein [bacterium]
MHIKKVVIILIIILFTIFIAFFFTLRIGFNTPLQPITFPPTGNIVIQGTMVCLPHKNTFGPQTKECAYGLRDDSGRYFSINDTNQKYKNISDIPMNVRVEIEGEFEPKSNTNYPDIGVIQVSHIKKLN